MKKKFFIIIFATLLCISALYMTATAEEQMGDITINNVVNSFDEETGVLTIKASYVTAMSYTDKILNLTKEIVILDGAISIEDGALCNFAILEKVTIPDSVTSIGYGAFMNCPMLEKYENGVFYIDKYAIRLDPDAEAITIKEGTVLIADGDPRGNTVFNMTSLSLPSSLLRIGDYSFAYAPNLSQVSICDGLVSIGYRAFYETALDDYEDGILYLDKYVVDIDFNITDVNVRESSVLICNGPATNRLGDRKWETITLPNSLKIIGDHSFTCSIYLNSVTIPEGVTHIGNYAFSSAEILDEISFPTSLTYIGDSAFRGCDALGSVIIPDNVTYIGANSFRSCDSLKSVTLGNGLENITQYAFYYCRSLENITFPQNLISIQQNAFEGCSSLTSIEIPDTVKTIANQVFRDCIGLKRVYCGEKMEILAPTAFSGCYGLEYIYLSDKNTVYTLYENGLIKDGELVLGSANTKLPQDGSLVSIAYGALAGKNIRSITIPASLMCIEGDVFDGCALLEEIKVAQDHPVYTSEGNCVIDNSRRVVAGCRTSVIPNDVTEILPDAFYGCVGLEKITIPATVTCIGDSAFQGCISLKELTFEEGDNAHLHIDQSAFYGTALVEVIFTRPVTLLDASFGYIDSLDRVIVDDEFEYISINEIMYGIKILPFVQSLNISYVSFISEMQMFENLDAFIYPESIAIDRVVIEHLVIPDYIEEIPSFRYANIKSLTIPEGVTYIGRYTFSDCKYLENIYYNAKSCTVEQGAFENCGIWGAGCTVTVGAGVTEIPDNFLSCLYFTSETNVVKVILPDGITRIGDGAFRYCSLLKDINLPSSLLSIGNEAFCDSGIEEMIVPYGVVSIGIAAFSQSAVRKIYIPDSVTDFGEYIFYFCLELEDCRLPSTLTELPSQIFCACESLEKITIPEGVTYIGSAAFSGCTSLKEIVLPPSLVHIDDSVFANCRALTELAIPSSVIYIGGGAFSSSGIKTLIIPAGVTSISNEIFYNLNQTKYILILSPYVWEVLPTLSFGERCSVKSVLSEFSMTDYDVIGKYTVKDTATIGGVMCRVYSDHTHAWAFGQDVEGAEEICYKDWTCSECLVNDRRLHHTISGEVTCTEDQICTECKALIAERLGHLKTEYDGVLPTCINSGYAPYFTCSRCNYSSYTYLAALGHELIIHDKQDPTCEDNGWSEYVTCSRCDYSTYEEIPLLEHDIKDFPSKNATCTEAGWLPYSACTRCGKNDKVIMDAMDHIIYHVEGREPTCTDGGWDAYSYCGRSSCDYSTYAYIEALGHDEILHNAKKPTCTEVGWRQYVDCSRCGYTTYTSIDALGHDEIYHEAKEPTCTEDGWYGYATCSRCNHSTYQINEAFGHYYVQHGAQSPTCTSAGHNDYKVCMRCGDSSYEEIAALGHDEIYHEAKEPTCNDMGWPEYINCSRCDYSTLEVLSALGHEVVEHNYQAPTCNDFGWQEYVACLRCDYSTCAMIEPLGHDVIWTDAVGPTCSDVGWSGYLSCLRCDYTTYEELQALGHDYSDDWVIDVEPTCTEPGRKSRHCLRCEDTADITVISASGHSYNDWYEAEAPTCTEEGTEERECLICFYHETRIIETKMHVGAEAVLENNIDATCTDSGSCDIVVYCSECSFEMSRESMIIIQLGHDYAAEWEEDVSPTCMTSGSSSRHCLRCGDKADVTEISALGHSFTDYKSNGDATYTENGTKTAQCDRCDKTDTAIDEGSALGLDQKFKDEVAAVTNGADMETTYQELYALLQTYASLSDEEKATVAAEFASVQRMINAYNEKAKVVNNEHAEATEVAFAPIISTGFVFLSVLWFLLKKKFFI